MLGDEASAPLWRRIQFALEKDLAEGAFSPGQKLPTEEELAERFDAHRHTIRRAIGRLQEKGLVRAEQGRGIFVQERVIVHALHPRSQLSKTSEKSGRIASRMVVGARNLRSTRPVASGLSLLVGTVVRRVETVRLIDGAPVAVTSHFFPLPRFDGIDRKVRELGSVSLAFRSYGIDRFTHVASRISARTPSQGDARLLQQPLSRPILHVSNISVDEMRKPIQFTQTRFASALVELIVPYGRLNDGG